MIRFNVDYPGFIAGKTYQVTEYDKPHAHLQSHGVEELSK
nr:MAG TPA: hypothetical protein [Caudoviricetes sp.]